MKFERPKGFIGSLPRNWIDKNLPKCPFCKLPSLWEIATEFKLGLNRYHFRCPNCLAILSIPVAAIEGATTGLGLTGWLLGKTASKNLRIESVGKNENLQHLVGSEFTLQTLQEWAKQT
ncbi:MAG: hypothetical protein QXJ31_05160 [Candidatus Bathyarchaeia archaeon]